MAKGRFAAKKEKKVIQWKKIALITGAVIGTLAIGAGAFFGIQALTDPLDSRMAEGVSIGGLDVSGMKKSEARQAVKATLEETLYTMALAVELPDESFSLSPAALSFQVDVDQAIKDAYAIGRKVFPEDTSLGLTPYLTMDDTAIQDALRYYAQTYDTDLTPATYSISGAQPVLNTAEFDPEAPGQTVTITKGQPDYHLDQEAVYDLILSAYDNALSWAAVDFLGVSHPYTAEALPEEFDLDGFYAEHCTAPVDDSLDMQTYQLVNGSYGYAFDLEEARHLLSLANYGESIEVPMNYTEPEILGDGVYFRDVLGYCETKHTDDANRNNNLRRACESMNGVILQPGEVFSYNDTLGQRTKANGYLPAGAYSGWELVQSYGGGICQGSSTIYCAALYADMEIVHRKNHGFRVGYMEPGLDATVNWGGPDFQFRNSSHFPIKIAAEVSDGYVKVTILGTEDRDYYIEMETEVQWGNSGTYAKSYRCKYDKDTGELISRDLEARSNYAS